MQVLCFKARIETVKSCRLCEISLAIISCIRCNTGLPETTNIWLTQVDLLKTGRATEQRLVKCALSGMAGLEDML